jgi:hypothetical protein
MKSVRYIGAATAAVAMAWASAARAAVMDQVPDSATAVLEIRNLDNLNTKISKFADTVGLTQSAPEFKDPLGAVEENLGISDKGINKSSDMAAAVFIPGTAGIPENGEPMGMFLIPVSDYQAFLGNFTNTKDDGGGITEGVDKMKDTVFVAHWGDYAAVAQSKDLLAKPPTGIKLTGAAADDLKKDAMLYVNMEPIRAVELPRLKDHRDELLKEMTDMQKDMPSEHLKNMFKAFDKLGLDEFREVLEDTKYAVVGADITDDGITAAVAAEFTPDSQFGKLAAAAKGTDQPMLAGLPDRKYLLLSGVMASPEFKQQFTAAILDPITKAFNAGGEDSKTISALIKAATDQWNHIDSIASGLAVPSALGKDGLIECVQVIAGDAAALKKDYTEGFNSMNDMTKSMVPAGQGGAQTTVKADATTVGDVHFDQYTMKIDTGAGPPPMQMQLIMNTVFGPEGPGGWIGVVNDKTLLQITGVDDQSALMADAVAAAKTGKDVLSDGKTLQSVMSLLPKQRVAEGFVYLDQIVSTGVKMGQMFGAPVRINVPDDLPPIGATLSSDGVSTVHLDVIVPTPLVQAMVGVVTNLQNMHGGGGPGGPNGPGGGL